MVSKITKQVVKGCLSTFCNCLYHNNVIVNGNREYNYIGNVLQCKYNYFVFWTNGLEYDYNYSESTRTSTTNTCTEYNYSIYYNIYI